MSGPLDTDLPHSHGHHLRSQSRLPLLAYYLDDVSPPSPPYPVKHHLMFPSAPRRRVLFAAFASLTALSLVAFACIAIFAPPLSASQLVSGSVPSQNVDVPDDNGTNLIEEDELEEYPHSPFVLGPPTQSFRDNLRNDTKYITSFISAGWTNDIMTYANLIYLGTLTDRIPIVAMFTPSHIGGDVPPIPFGEVFDVPRFIQDSGIQILEWDEVKDPQSEVYDDIGCWNVWEAVQNNEHFPRGSAVPSWLKLDISYTKAPSWLKLIPDYPHDMCSTFWSLARLGFSEERARNIGHALPSPLHGARLDPDEHLLCYDYLYYACAQQSYEFDYDYSPTWRYVVRHFRWTQRVEDITAFYLRQSFGLPSDAEIPPYIAIHARHGDFENWCWAAEKPEDCFAPLSVIARRVKEIQDELRRRKGVDIPMTRVVITSDEKDPVWWDEVAALGWVKIDHDAAHTADTFGRWWPVILDASIQSNALGFVGTDRSTYSIISRRRVETWQDGATRTVKWGYKGADDH